MMKGEVGGPANIGFQDLSEIVLCEVRFRLGERNDAVSRHCKCVIAYVCVIGSKKNALLTSNAGDDKLLGSEVLQQCIQRGGKEANAWALECSSRPFAVATVSQ